ncbi:hypothetical protein [Leptospira weilii]|uniref:hypothetical protein n=1 Tax=Leptospira weilii TaxID=28184 RepID=UPI00138EDAD4|nr:hypothetical protein [Leptospira weilii]
MKRLNLEIESPILPEFRSEIRKSPSFFSIFFGKHMKEIEYSQSVLREIFVCIFKNGLRGFFLRVEVY